MTSVCPICGASVAEGSSSVCPIASQWADEERMTFLTSYPSPDDTSAQEQITTFWSKAVTHAFECAPSLAMELRILAHESLAWLGSTSPGIGLATAHMLSKDELILREEVEVGTGFGRRLLVDSLAYLMGMAGLSSSPDKFPAKVPAGHYIHRGVLESLSEALQAFCEKLPDNERTVYLNDCKIPMSIGPAESIDMSATRWSFQQLCNAAGEASSTSGVSSRLLPALRGDDLTLMAGYLVRTKRAVREGGILKVMARRGGRRWNATCPEISETDKDLLRLRCTVGSLKTNACDLARRMDLCRKDALWESRQGERQAALVHMRRMKQLKMARGKCLSSLLTLEAALDQVKQLEMDKQVLEAHKAATHALKSCRETHGLTVEKVEDTFDALSEEMSKQHDISSALAEANGLFLSDDEEMELEELAGLLQAEGDTSDPYRAATDSLPDRHDVSSNATSVIGGAVHFPNRRNIGIKEDSKDEVGIKEPSPGPKPEAAV